MCVCIFLRGLIFVLSVNFFLYHCNFVVCVLVFSIKHIVSCIKYINFLMKMLKKCFIVVWCWGGNGWHGNSGFVLCWSEQVFEIGLLWLPFHSSLFIMWYGSETCLLELFLKLLVLVFIRWVWLTRLTTPLSSSSVLR